MRQENNRFCDTHQAGQVIVWDHGTYRNVTDDPDHPTPMADAIEDGKVEVFFEGTKIKGAYALIRMHRADEEREDWLLIKLKDEYVGSLPEDLEDQGESVLTGRTVKDLKRLAKAHRPHSWSSPSFTAHFGDFCPLIWYNPDWQSWPICCPGEGPAFDEEVPPWACSLQQSRAWRCAF